MIKLFLFLNIFFFSSVLWASANGGRHSQLESTQDYYGREQHVDCLEGFECPKAKSFEKECVVYGGGVVYPGDGKDGYTYEGRADRCIPSKKGNEDFVFLNGASLFRFRDTGGFRVIGYKVEFTSGNCIGAVAYVSYITVEREAAERCQKAFVVRSGK
jgi:hypothetical protein